jgi:diguanylate cyclase (GGDEF)-like protein
MISETKKLIKILKGGFINSVFQPIVSLTDGKVFGYEALSRITKSELRMNIEGMFRLAEKLKLSWELELLCREKALKSFSFVYEGKRLFLNVNPHILCEPDFKSGFTKEKLKNLNIPSENVIMEITENTSYHENDLFTETIAHYKKQGFCIAIDDVGSGFSGLNAIIDLKPQYIKLDMHLVRNVDKDNTKMLLCKAMTDFCKSAGIKIIAEGIETEEELKTLIKLGIDYGQGYLLGVPHEVFTGISKEHTNLIKTYHTKHYKEKISSSVYPTIEHLCKTGHVISPHEKVASVHEIMQKNPTIMEFTVVENDNAKGFMTRNDLNELLGGRFGFSLFSKEAIGLMAKHEFLRVNCDMQVDDVSRIAMQRSYDKLYNPIVVEKDDKYFGVVTIKDLLETCTKIEIDTAKHSSPLTGLPGNLVVEKEIKQRIFSDNPYCVTYYDLDNFKAYNDAYGFDNGDLMIKLTAEILLEEAKNGEVVGHIGGDDFIVIGDYSDAESFCKKVIDSFEQRVTSLYSNQDVERGFIVSKNRNGVTENFPLASISIGGVTSNGKKYSNTEEFSKDVAKLKKKSKKNSGSCYYII